MRNKIQLTVDNVKLGQRVKIGVPSYWCQVGTRVMPLWKGKVVEVNRNEAGEVRSITVLAKLLKCGKKCFHSYVLSERFFCPVSLFRNTGGIFRGIYLAK